MFKYDGSDYSELTFAQIDAEAEERDGQWIDVYFRFALAEGDRAPAELVDPSGWLICTKHGEPAQYVVLDEGCDTEYQFTEDEKRQIMAHVEEAGLLRRTVV